MKRALIVATVGRFYEFLKSDIRILQNHGYEVHCATNLQLSELDGMNGYENVVKHQIDFARSPFSKTNIKAYRQLQLLMKNNHFEIIHCHTPMGAALGRLVAKKYRNRGTSVYYTAHGLHFYKGAPLKNWIVYFPIEWLSSFWTDTMLTINQEDYMRASHCFHAKRIFYIPSIGINIEKYERLDVDINKKRSELGIAEDEVMIVSVGELSARKNQQIVIAALARMNLQNVKYVLVGDGDKREELSVMAQKCHIEHQVVFLGHRDDVGGILKAADLFVISSVQEGVSMALLEAIACQTPVVCSNIRGTIDVIKNSELLFDPNDIDGLQCLLRQVCVSSDDTSRHADRMKIKETMKPYIEENSKRLKKFDVKKVAHQMEKIYFG